VIARLLEPRLLLFGALTGTAITVLAAGHALLSYLVSPLLVPAAISAVTIAAIVIRAPIVGVYGTILSVPLEIFDLRLGSFGLTVTESLALLTAGATLLRRPAHGTPRVDSAHIAFGLGLLTMAAGLTIAVDAFTTAKILVMWTAFLAISVFISRHARTVEVERIVVCTAIAAAAVGAIAISTTGSQQAALGGAVVTNRAEGSFSDPNQLAFFLVLGLPCCIAATLREPSARRSTLFAMTIALASAGLILTLSRSAMIGALVSLAVMALWRRFRRAAVAGVVILLAYLAINPQVLSGSQVSLVATRFATVTQLQDTYGNARLSIYSATPSIIADHPLVGIGAGNFPRYSIPYGLSQGGGGAFAHAHNVFLTVAAELGLLGLVALIFFIWAVSRHALTVLLNRSSHYYSSGIALTAALAGLLLTAIPDYPPGSNPVMAVLMIQIGALIRLARSQSGDSVR